jgi:site-specific recombinase XerD
MPFTSFNRGMSLEAIAALLGHKSMTMTMVYARIADRTVRAPDMEP